MQAQGNEVITTESSLKSLTVMGKIRCISGCITENWNITNFPTEYVTKLSNYGNIILKIVITGVSAGY